MCIAAKTIKGASVCATGGKEAKFPLHGQFVSATIGLVVFYDTAKSLMAMSVF